MKIWESFPILFWTGLGLVFAFFIFYLVVYLGMGSLIAVETFKNNILPAILERNQEIEKILEFLPR